MKRDIFWLTGAALIAISAAEAASRGGWWLIFGVFSLVCAILWAKQTFLPRDRAGQRRFDTLAEERWMIEALRAMDCRIIILSRLVVVEMYNPAAGGGWDHVASGFTLGDTLSAAIHNAAMMKHRIGDA